MAEFCQITKFLFTVISGKTLERVPNYSYLGVVLDEKRFWKDHVGYVSNKVSRRLGLLSRIRSCLSLEASKQYTLHSCSHYLTMLMLQEISEGCCKELRRLQNRTARIILRKSTSNDTFCVLNWSRCFDIVFQRPYRYFSTALKVILSLSDRYKIFTND